MISLTTLGTFVLRAEGAAVATLPTDKVRALCTYLALEAPHPHRREQLAALLWPDILHESALTNLRQTLYRLRTVLEQGQNGATDTLVTINRQTVQLHQEQWSVDAVTFAQLLDEWEHHSHDDLANCEACLARLTQAVALYGGELLAGFGLPDAPAFEEWLLFQRQRLQHQLLRALTALAAAYEVRGDDEIAQRYTERLLACDAYHEAHHRQIMRLLARRGRISQALAHYDTCRRLLRDELGVAPDAETTALYHQIKAGEVGKAPLVKSTLPAVNGIRAKAAQAHSTQEQPSTAKVTSGKVSADYPLPPSPLYPFVARVKELARLEMGLMRMLAGHGQLLFVTGEAGSGKTTLVRAFAQHALSAHPTLVVVDSLCSAQTVVGDPYLPFRMLLNHLAGTTETTPTHSLAPSTIRAGTLLPLLATALVERGAGLLESFVSGAALLARAESVSSGAGDWLPRLRTRVAQVQAAEGVVAQNHIFAEYTAVLQQVATQYPLLLIIDDLHWADASSLALLFHLLRNIERSRLFILTTYRPEETLHGEGDKAHPLAALVSEAKRSFGDIVIDLDQATARSGRSFVDALLDSEPNRLGERFRQALFAHTQGHPLFTIELLRDLEARGELRRNASGRWMEPPAMDWTALPARVEGVIEARIGRLPLALRELLQAASVEGEDFTVEVVARVLALSEREVLRRLDNELDRHHRLVSAQAIAASDTQQITRYRFRHNLFQHYLYNKLSAGELRLLHGDVAEALVTLYGADTDPIALQLARHFAEAGQNERATEYAIRAGDASARAFAFAEARLHYERALNLIATLGNTVKLCRIRIDTTCKYADAALGFAPSDQVLAQIKTAEPLLSTLPVPLDLADRTRRAWLYRWLGHFAKLSGDTITAFSYLQPLLAETQAIANEELEADVSGLLGFIYSLLGRFAQAAPLLEQVLSFREKQGNLRKWAQNANDFGVVLAHLGQCEEGIALVQRCLQIAQTAHDDQAIVKNHWYLAWVYLLVGDATHAFEQLQLALEIAEQVGQIAVPDVVYLFRSWLRSRQGEHDLAQEDFARVQQHDEFLQSVFYRTIYTEITLNAGQNEQALTLAKQTVIIARTIGDLWVEGSAHRMWAQALSTLEPPLWTEVDLHFAESLRAFEEGGAYLEAARTHVAWGKTFAQRSEKPLAGEHFEKSAAQFETSGLARELDEVCKLLTALRSGANPGD